MSLASYKIFLQTTAGKIYLLNLLSGDNPTDNLYPAYRYPQNELI